LILLFFSAFAQDAKPPSGSVEFISNEDFMIRIYNARAQINHLNRAIKEAFRKTATMQAEIPNSKVNLHLKIVLSGSKT
jgi:hypothetical protein